MTYTSVLTSLIVIFLSISGHAQWGQYEATWEDNPGVMSVNLDIQKLAPVDDLGFLLELSHSGQDCDNHGIISGLEIQNSELLAMDVDSIIATAMYIEDVGRLLYQCEIKDYFYIQDSAVANQILEAIYGLSLRYKIINDPNWKIYLDFIYPDDFLFQTMINKRILDELHQVDYNFEEKSLLQHLASFSSEEDRHEYRRFLIQNNYKIINMSSEQDAALPYIISFSRRDKLHLERLSNITLRLHNKAIDVGGSYDGWGIEL